MSDDWDFYFLRVDDQAASIFVNLGLRQEAPIRGHGTMGYLRVVMRRPGEDGLSSQDEYDDLMALEDGIVPRIIEGGTAVFVGRSTSGGTRDFYFYVVDPGQFANAAHAAMREFPDYKYQIDAREDRDWRAYFEFLYPSDVDLQCILNRRVRQQLQEHGDNPNSERKIDHLALLPSREAQTALAQHVAAEGFTIESAADAPNAEGLFALEFSKVDQVARIDAVVVPLFLKIAELGGAYDGWGCPVSS
jgi:hypothetical protein